MIRAFFATLALIAVTSNAIALDSDESVKERAAKIDAAVAAAAADEGPALDGAKDYKGVSADIAARGKAFTDPKPPAPKKAAAKPSTDKVAALKAKFGG